MRLRGIALLAALALPLLVVPAAATGGDLVLEGVGNASTEITLSRPADLHLDRLIPDAQAEFSGVAIRDAAGNTLGAAMQVRRWTEGATAPYIPPPVTTRYDGLHLKAGRYEVLLLAAGKATVRVPATGGLVGIHQTTERAVGVSVRLTDLRTSGLPVTNYRAPVVVGPKQLAVLVFHVRATAHQLSLPQQCFAAPGSPTCVNAFGSTTVLASPASVGDGYLQSMYAVYGSLGEAGTHHALVQDATVDVPRCLDALLVAV